MAKKKVCEWLVKKKVLKGLAMKELYEWLAKKIVCEGFEDEGTRIVGEEEGM